MELLCFVEPRQLAPGGKPPQKSRKELHGDPSVLIREAVANANVEKNKQKNKKKTKGGVLPVANVRKVAASEC